MRKIISRAALLMLLLAAVTVTVCAGTLKFVLPEETYGAEPKVTIDLYKGALAKSGNSLKSAVKDGTMSVLRSDVGTETEMPAEAGLYTYYVHGDGFYSVAQLIELTEEDLAAGTKTVKVHGGKRSGNGFEPGKLPADAPDGVSRINVDSLMILPTEEMLEHFQIEPQNYQSPAFAVPRAAYATTTQTEMMTFVADCAAANGKLHQYSIGTSAVYGFDMPLVLATETEIPAGASLDDAAALVRANGKPTVWLHGQIHGNEPAACEGLLVMLYRFAHDADTIGLLEKINVVIVPRISRDSAYLFQRKTADGYDPNRDHITSKNIDLIDLHAAWRKFMPEATVDHHEFVAYSFNRTKQYNGIVDVETTPATSMNVDPKVSELSFAIETEMLDAAFAAGLRATHYGTAKFPATGRLYFGIYDGLSFLVESRGIGFATENYERRVRSHEVMAQTVLKYVAENADAVRDTVKEARARMTEGFKTYDPERQFVLYQVATGRTTAPKKPSTLGVKPDGKIITLKNEDALKLYDRAMQQRPYPTAYVLSADLEGIDRILELTEKHGLERIKLDAGTEIELQQYCYVADHMGESDGKQVKFGIDADLREAQTVTFANGAYLFPMDQVGAKLMAFLFEPDTNDGEGSYDASLVALGFVEKDEAGNYPIYRYIGNDPRGTFCPQVAAEEQTADPVSAVSPAVWIAVGAAAVAGIVWLIAAKRKGKNAK